MTDKWIIYYGEQYYPSIEVFTSEAQARIMWKQECDYRKDDLGGYWHGSYLVKVIEEKKPKGET